jgi:hypothetical protein
VPERLPRGVEDGRGVRGRRVELEQAEELRDEAVRDRRVLSRGRGGELGAPSGASCAQREVAAVEEGGAVDEDEAVLCVCVGWSFFSFLSQGKKRERERERERERKKRRGGKKGKK